MICWAAWLTGTSSPSIGTAGASQPWRCVRAPPRGFAAHCWCRQSARWALQARRSSGGRAPLRARRGPGQSGRRRAGDLAPADREAVVHLHPDAQRGRPHAVARRDTGQRLALRIPAGKAIRPLVRARTADTGPTEVLTATPFASQCCQITVYGNDAPGWPKLAHCRRSLGGRMSHVGRRRTKRCLTSLPIMGRASSERLVRSDCTERLVLRRHDCETAWSSPGLMHT